MLSVRSRLSGRTLSPTVGRSGIVSMFLSVGNCSLGPGDAAVHRKGARGIAPVYVSNYPNAGLPNPLSDTGLTKLRADGRISGMAENGWLNMVGGCWHDTDHIRSRPRCARCAEPFLSRPPREHPASGDDPPGSGFQMIGTDERDRVAGSPLIGRRLQARGSASRRTTGRT